MDKKRLIGLVSGGMILPLAIYTLLGFSSRYMADDYCTASKALQYGVIGSTVDWYMTWAGQYTNWTLKGIAGVIGSGVASALPMLLVVGWAAAAIWTVYQLVMLLHIQQPVMIAALLGTTWVYAIFAGAPSLIQSLYWLGASIPYTMPLIVLTFYVGFVAYLLRLHPDGKIPLWMYIFTGMLTFVFGGLSEAYVLFQGAILTAIAVALFIAAPSPVKRGGLTLLTVGLAGSALAFIVILIAPGNSVRQASFGDALPIIEIILRTLRVTASFFASAIGVFSPVPLLVTLTVPAVLFSQIVTFEQPLRITPRRARGLLAVSGGLAIVLLFVVIGPPIYATSVAPAPRVYLAAHVVMVCTAGFWGCVIGLSLRKARSGVEIRPGLPVIVILTLVVLIGPLWTALQSLNRLPAYSTFAAEWDKRDKDIRRAAASGITQIEVDPLSVDLAVLGGLDTIGDDPNGWVNVCAADYYGVDSIAVQAS